MWGQRRIWEQAPKLYCFILFPLRFSSYLNQYWGSRTGSQIVPLLYLTTGSSKLLCEQQNQCVLISSGFAFFTFLRPNQMTNRWILSAFPSVVFPSSCFSTHCLPTDFQELVQGCNFLLDSRLLSKWVSNCPASSKVIGGRGLNGWIDEETSYWDKHCFIYIKKHTIKTNVSPAYGTSQ